MKLLLSTLICFLIGAVAYLTASNIYYNSQNFKTYKARCDEGKASGCTLLGLMYEKGRFGVTQDFAQAAALYRKACDGGDAVGCLGLSSHYLGRNGGKYDEDQAIKLMEKACELNLAEACAGLYAVATSGRARRIE